MTSWNAGYVAEIEYTHGYYRELSPRLMSFALLNRSVTTRLGRAPRYLELGYGQGISLNIHAAACPGEYWGTDFIPSQAALAAEMAEATGSGAHILDQSFTELAARDDLPEFDVIVLHGIWSWIAPEHRAAIVDLARRRLAVGGVFYISYNCVPGWSAAAPLRHLMALHAERAGSDANGIVPKLDASVAFVQTVADAGAAYFRANPAVIERLKRIKEQDRNYLAHEYFNQHWLPMAFSEVSDILAEAKMEFAASGNLIDHIDIVNLTPEGQQLLAGMGQPVLRETVRDYLVNQAFRKDLFVKGGRTMPPLEQLAQFRALEFMLTVPVESVSMKFQGPAGEVKLQEGVYQPLAEMLAADGYAPKSVTRLLADSRWEGQNLSSLVQALTILSGTGQAHPVQDAETIAAAQPYCRALNTYVCERARYSGDMLFLASPVAGGGIPVSRFLQLFLLARQDGGGGPEAWAAFAWEILNSQGQKILKEGKPLEDPADNLAELTGQARQFVDRHLPLLQALGIAE